MVYINDGCNDVTFFGEIGSVNVIGSNINVSTNQASISNITLSGENTSLTVSKDTKVNNVTLVETASKVKVVIAGTVTKISSNSAKSVVQVTTGGKVDAILANKPAAGIKIDVAEGATIKQVRSDAKETVIDGKGKLEFATLNGNDSSISIPDAKLTLGKGVTGIKIGINYNENVTPAPTTTPAPTQAPSTGGGFPSGGGGQISNPTPSEPTVPSTTPTPIPTGTPTPDPTAVPTIPATATPTPSVPTPEIPTNQYQTDDRFVEGYPQIVMGEATDEYSNNILVHIKLKDGVASAENPAKLYYVISSANMSWDASSESVIHGHLGTDTQYEDGVYHNTIYASDSGAIRITNSDEITIPIKLNKTNSEGVVFYFVIKTEEDTSTVPTKIEFTADTVSSYIDQYPPSIRATYWSAEKDSTIDGQKQRTIRVYVDEELDTTRVVSGSAFTVTKHTVPLDEVSITDVSIHALELQQFSPYRNCIDLVLNYPVGTDLSWIQIAYHATDTNYFADVANTPNKMQDFTLYETLPSDKYFNSSYYKSFVFKDPKPVIQKMHVSGDGKYVGIHISPSISYFSQYQVIINGKIWIRKSGSWSADSCTLYLYNENAQKENSYDIVITDGKGNNIVDFMCQEYDSIFATITNPIDSTITPQTATLDITNQTMKFVLTNVERHSSYACEYVLTVDGKEYRLRGNMSIKWSGIDYKDTTFVFDAMNMFDVDFSTIKPSSKVTLSLRSLSTTAHRYNDSFTEASGKPVDAFSVDVTIME